MAKRLQFRKVLMLAVALATGFACLGYRLVDLQVLQHDKLRARADRNTHRALTMEPRRGNIFDARGSLLATSVFARTLFAVPSRMAGKQGEVAHALAPLLEMPESEVIQRLTPKAKPGQVRDPEGADNRQVPLKKTVPLETWERIQAAMAALVPTDKKFNNAEKAFYRGFKESIIAEEDQLRIYPNGQLAAHVLGYVGETDPGSEAGRASRRVGRAGIEARFDQNLRGVRGWRVTEIDRHKEEQVAWREQDVEAHDGLNVVLTIDSVVQYQLEAAIAAAMEKHSAASVSGVVIRPRTGQVLAMASVPTFDLNSFNRSSPEARRNRVVEDCIEPGSTFKIVVVSAALNERVVQLTDTFDCEHGHFFYAGKNLHDHEPYPIMSVERIITKSSNIGAAKIGIKLGEARLYDYIKDFGFGAPTGLPLPAESPGIVHALKNWTKVSIAQIPMGQGVAVTRMQMLMAMCAIANDGWLMRPMLVDRMEDSEHHVVAQYSPQRVRQVVSTETAHQMVTALKTVVGPDGTAAGAALPHYSVAGKTGTAQKAEHGIYVPGKYVSSFIGFLPAEHPEICISIVIDEPKGGHYGGSTAGPVFKELAQRLADYLNIRPDDADGLGIVQTAGVPPNNREGRAGLVEPVPQTD
jgi:cell division protein FtsI/penicillin-binding protein 2